MPGRQRFLGPALVALGPQDADEIVLERQLVDDGQQSLAVADDRQSARVVPPR